MGIYSSLVLMSYEFILNKVLKRNQRNPPYHKYTFLESDNFVFLAELCFVRSLKCISEFPLSVSNI